VRPNSTFRFIGDLQRLNLPFSGLARCFDVTANVLQILRYVMALPEAEAKRLLKGGVTIDGEKYTRNVDVTIEVGSQIRAGRTTLSVIPKHLLLLKAFIRLE